MQNILRVALIAAALLIVSAGVSRANPVLPAGSRIAVNSGISRIGPRPQMEEPRGPNVFIWYCCNGVRFHSVTVDSGASPFIPELEWGVSYSSVSIRLPDCRGGKVSVSIISEGLDHTNTYHYVNYAVSATLINGASMADCDVIADLYQNGQIVNSQDFRLMIQQ